jgi:hypothetical protein
MARLEADGDRFQPLLDDVEHALASGNPASLQRAHRLLLLHLSSVFPERPR